MTKNMTQGNAMRLILAFTLPLLLGDLFQQTYNIVDTAIVGRTLGADALGSVGVSSSVQFLVLGFCQGLCAGFGIPVAQSFGAQNLHRMRQEIYHAAVIAVVLAISLTALCASLCGSILRLIQTPDELYADAWAYLFVIFCGIPCTILYNFCASILRAVGDSRTPFFFLALSAILNIGLDFFCILCLHWGVAGAAIATIFSQGLSGVLCLIVIVKKFEILHLQKEDRVLDRGILWHAFSMGVPMGLQFSITAIGSMVMQSANNSLGSLYVSGFAAGNKIKQFSFAPYNDMSAAVATFLGQNYGAGDMKRVRTGIKDGIIITAVYSVLIGFVLIHFGRPLSMLFLSGEYGEVLDASAQYLRCMGWFFWLLGVLILLRNIIQGLGYPGLAIFGGVLEMIARTVVALTAVPVFGYTAICYTDQAAWVAATIYLIVALRMVLKKAERKLQQTDPA